MMAMKIIAYLFDVIFRIYIEIEFFNRIFLNLFKMNV